MTETQNIFIQLVSYKYVIFLYKKIPEFQRKAALHLLGQESQDVVI